VSTEKEASSLHEESTVQQEVAHNLKCHYSDQDDLDGSVVPVSDQGDLLLDSVAVLDAEKSFQDVVELPSGEEAVECCDSE